MRVAVIQMNSTPEVQRNLEQAKGLLERARGEGAGVALLPEAFAYLGPDVVAAGVGENIAAGGGPILSFCQELASRLQMELVLGGFWESCSQLGAERVFNTCVHLDENGGVRATYRKIHLYDVSLADGTQLQESAKVAAGQDVIVSDSSCGKLGLSICYDLRFPELYRALVDKGAQVLCVPAAFTSTTGKDHWHALLRARAIESQSYVLAAAQVGNHYGTRSCYGHALVVDPWGVVRAECAEEPDIAIATIDLKYLERIRTQLPSLQHRVQL